MVPLWNTTDTQQILAKWIVPKGNLETISPCSAVTLLLSLLTSPSLPQPNIHCSTPPTHTHTHTPLQFLIQLECLQETHYVKRWPIFSKCLSLKLFLLFSPVCHLTVAVLVLILTSWATQDLFSQVSTVPFRLNILGFSHGFSTRLPFSGHTASLELHPASGKISCWTARLIFLV